MNYRKSLLRREIAISEWWVAILIEKWKKKMNTVLPKVETGKKEKFHTEKATYGTKK